MSTLHPTKKFFASLAVVAVAALPLAACSSGSDSGSSSDSSSSSSTPPKAVASITALTGEDTAVALDTGFTDALESLGLTPGTVGDGALEDGSLVFPITGGNVEVFTPGEVSPYVIGQIQHEGSGFSLTAGDTEVEITNLNVDPGASRVYGDVAVNGETAVTSAYIFTLNGSTLKPLQSEGDTAILEGTQVLISPVAADLLNQTFDTDAVTPELLVGIAKITVNTTSGDDGN
ncbi:MULTISPECIES: hypothetical protein [unclassified Aeromicrobium]|uniref:hypothetical protein n=1 Tax=unclassified Aeromicrobium TaxID=2633570 RepID=UPI0006F27C3C|nr:MULTISPECIES: hypothetical protein [unclassified Aeromicrobium]KQO42833.1 hypothetical protein ASF05_00885 [Aeromicrobium sp. Leaf245]KQP26810.1 hypothetical protein ASF38_07365 [Aeromicrobium sp. Leaf272]KQP77924.1 hypothetical protein ASF37_04680 [Aeromicrobium sp. Leaf289]